MHDIKQKGVWHKVKIQDKTKNRYNLPTEISTQPNIDRQNNIILGIAIGVMIMACAGILVFGLVAEGLIS